jgi:hypothetical protein
MNFDVFSIRLLSEMSSNVENANRHTEIRTGENKNLVPFKF